MNRHAIWNRAGFWSFMLAGLLLAVYLLRLSGPTDLEADAQQRNVGYVMDAVWRGHWLVQTEVRGWLMSKPPLHTWIAGALAEFGGINRLTLTLPSALSVLALALLLFRVGRQRFGMLAGGFAGVALIMALLMARHVALVRTDALFALTIALAAFAAFRAWETGRGWLLFWLAGAAATLVKGPLGLVLAAAGLLAWFWEKRTDPAAPRPRGRQWPGILLFLGLTLGWLGLAVHAYGYPLIDKLFFDELFGQATGMRKDIVPGEHFIKVIPFYAVRFFPFSLFALYGMWRIVRAPAVDAGERRFERFLFVWIAAGMLIFSLGAHFRPDLLLPLWPAGALLAGREMARLGERIGRHKMLAGTAIVAFLLLGAMFRNYHVSALKNKEVRYSVAAEQAAQALLASGLDLRRIRHLDTAVTLQMYLGSYDLYLKEDEALRLTADSGPLLLAVESPTSFPRIFGASGSLPAAGLQEVFRWPADPGQKALVYIYANAAAQSSAGKLQ